MTYKTVVLKHGYHYTGTTVPFSRSVTQIKELLKKHKCDKIAEIDEGQNKTSLYFMHSGYSFVIKFPITYLESERGRNRNLNMNISGRIIHDRIKAMLVDVEIGYMSFAQSMMPYLALSGPDGSTPLHDHIEVVYKTGGATGLLDDLTRNMMISTQTQHQMMKCVEQG